jgi:hypothetical protein
MRRRVGFKIGDGVSDSIGAVVSQLFLESVVDQAVQTPEFS